MDYIIGLLMSNSHVLMSVVFHGLWNGTNGGHHSGFGPFQSRSRSLTRLQMTDLMVRVFIASSGPGSFERMHVSLTAPLNISSPWFLSGVSRTHE